MGTEVGVAPTKAFTTRLVAHFLLALMLAQSRGPISAVDEARWMKALRHLPAAIRARWPAVVGGACDSTAAAGVSHRCVAWNGCGQAAEFGEERDGGVSESAAHTLFCEAQFVVEE